MKKLGGYYRVSTGPQGVDGNALERYREQLLNFGVDEEYLYHDIESGSSETRAGFLRLCAAIEAGHLSAIAIPAQHRLHRSVVIWAKFTALLTEYNVDLYELDSSSQTPVDFTSPTGEFVNYIKAAQAQVTRRENQKHSLDGYAKARRDGKTNKAPFGYRLSRDRRIVPDDAPYFDTGETRWAVAQWLVKIYFETGTMLGTITRAKERYGTFDATRDRPCTVSGLKYWLHNPALRGHTGYFTLVRPGQGKPHQVAGLERDTHPALISAQQYRDIQRMAAAPRGTAKNANPLAGLLYCAECGGRMRKETSSPKGGKRYSYYRCSQATPVKGTVKSTLPCTHKKGHRVETVKQQVIAALKAEAEKIGTAAAQSDEPEINPAIQKLREDILKLQATGLPEVRSLIKAKQQEIAALSDNVIAPDDDGKRKLAQALAGNDLFWSEATDEELATLWFDLLERVEVLTDGSVRVSFAFNL